MQNPTTAELFNFPCDYPLKVMGLDCPELKPAMITIIQNHVGKLRPQQIRQKQSKKGKYVSYTVNVIISSKKQIDALNQALQNCPLVNYIL